MEKILKYIFEKYAPHSLILYGSYADETNQQGSDFDALVITSGHPPYHDTSFVDNVALDVFVYPASTFEKPYDPGDFVQIFDGKIICDTNDTGRNLQINIRNYLSSLPFKTTAEIKSDIDWCLKMQERTKRGDAEGLYRWHWLLADSLEIFCQINRHPYLGPEKSLKWMNTAHPHAFSCYKKALSDFSPESLHAWISFLKDAFERACL